MTPQPLRSRNWFGRRDLDGFFHWGDAARAAGRCSRLIPTFGTMLRTLVAGNYDAANMVLSPRVISPP